MSKKEKKADNNMIKSSSSTGWKGELGIVREEEEDSDQQDTITSHSLSPSVSSAATPLQYSREETRSQLPAGRETNVEILLQGRCYNLLKEPLISRSSYLELQLKELNRITLPFNITAETFTLVTDFCYGSEIVITPYNVAALITAAELLGMTDTRRGRGDNLKQIAKKYFQQVIADNRELALVIFHSCLRLLPEAETTAKLVSKCIKALNLREEGDQLLDSFLDAIINLGAEEFRVVAGSMQRAMISHDLLYKMVDLYIKEHSTELSDEQKMDICSCIDCSKLSSQHLMDAVLNRRMPVRFNIGALLIEHLVTRHAVYTVAGTNHRSWRQQQNRSSANTENTTTLGSILLGEQVRRESAQIKAQMDNTKLHIQSLERELANVRKLLEESEEERSLLMEEENQKLISKRANHKLLHQPETEEERKERSIMESTNSSSFHFGYREGEEERKERSIMESTNSSSFHFGYREGEIEKGERGSTSFASFQPCYGGKRTGMMRSSVHGNHLPLSSSYNDASSAGNNKKEKSKGFVSKLFRSFWLQKSAPKGRSTS